MRNSISACALSEFVNEVRERPEEGIVSYGVQLAWESGTRSRVETKTMAVGPHRVSRSFTWMADEPRQLVGTNHGPSPQELLLSGLGACIMVSFLAGATAMGIQIESLSVDVDAELALHGFLGLETNKPTRFSGVHYHIAVAGDGTPEQFEALRREALTHSPNANALARGVALEGDISVR